MFFLEGWGEAKNCLKTVLNFCKDDIVTVVGVSALLELPGVVISLHMAAQLYRLKQIFNKTENIQTPTLLPCGF